MKPVGVPKIIRRVYPNRLWSINTAARKLYLTFDDGPIPEVTPWVLEQLNEFNAKATFFCIGENVEKNPEIFKRVAQEGHLIGNHTFNHLKGWKTSTEKYFENVLQAQDVIEKHLFRHQKEKKFFRPPYGKMTTAQAKTLEEKGFRIVMWSVLPYDYDSSVSPEQCLRYVLENATSGSIIVFHDSLKARKNLEYVLPRVLREFSEQGYQFESLAAK